MQNVFGNEMRKWDMEQEMVCGTDCIMEREMERGTDPPHLFVSVGQFDGRDLLGILKLQEAFATVTLRRLRFKGFAFYSRPGKAKGIATNARPKNIRIG